MPKICEWVARTKKKLNNNEVPDILELGNFDARITVLAAQDIVKGAWAALNHERAQDWTFSSSRHHSIRDILETAIHSAEIPCARIKCNVASEQYILASSKLIPLVSQNPNLFFDTHETYQDAEIWRTKHELGWTSELTFPQIIKEMVEYYAKSE